MRAETVWRDIGERQRGETLGRETLGRDGGRDIGKGRTGDIGEKEGERHWGETGETLGERRRDSHWGETLGRNGGGETLGTDGSIETEQRGRDGGREIGPIMNAASINKWVTLSGLQGQLSQQV